MRYPSIHHVDFELVFTREACQQRIDEAKEQVKDVADGPYVERVLMKEIQLPLVEEVIKSLYYYYLKK